MGLLVDGKWQDKWYDTSKNGGKFERQASKFRDNVSNDEDAKYPVESGRYHLYVSLACPWAHRALIFRKLKGLEEHIDVSVVHPEMLDNGWEFKEYPGSTGDKLYGFDYAHQIYTKAKPEITTRVTVPILWDKQTETIVNNESAEIIRIFNSGFNALTSNDDDYYPEALRQEIDDINEMVYHDINNGVYKAGFATTQKAYEEAVNALFHALDIVDERLSKQRYLVGSNITEADWRLFTTLIRFDAVYHGHFKCNKKQIADYPNIYGYMKELYQVPGVAETVNFDHIKRHYYFSHTMINPTQIIPVGPEQDLMSAHGRENIG
ncbi:glutathione S-transferase [Alteromonas macleodii str. 'Black Sea 11']|uniref:glutathione S-transferase family protein n=1 Tax=Alteromonas abrolhosensis TaxID=1892904 RepID=UPI000286F004|nr:glutathione S-transferase [Alteromonas macleodii str. 'Black Sea 11']NKX04743.1 glutathione S-transferase family protein [Alteromonadaceae bacterium A_SAG6]NKX18205.1 glutathione S-transferase family protein [Alteromonadaceae bacterium A_SAG5]NKX35217.1 glutathione S-transferase family protein [Alteromonadaceae bacterium A_SAG3]